jgi:hypothetical protein
LKRRTRRTVVGIFALASLGVYGASAGTGGEASGPAMKTVPAVASAVDTVDSPIVTVDGDGTYLVGDDIRAGRWKSAGGEMCYWARAADDSGDLSALIANHVGPGRQVVTIKDSDGVFITSGCADWIEQTE